MVVVHVVPRYTGVDGVAVRVGVVIVA